jgi:hypothetical protein
MRVGSPSLSSTRKCLDSNRFCDFSILAAGGFIFGIIGVGLVAWLRGRRAL